VIDTPGSRDLGAAYDEARSLATRQDRAVRDAGEATRRRVAAAIRRELDAIRGEAQPQPTTTTRGGGPSRTPYARRGAPARARG
jgi:hypothetical protein